MKEDVHQFTLELCVPSETIKVSGPNHSASYDRETLASRIRFIRGMRKRPKFGHFYENTLQAHSRALELLEGCFQ